MYFRVTQGNPPTVGPAIPPLGAARAVAVAGVARAALHPGHQRPQARGQGRALRAPAQAAAGLARRHPREHQGAPAAAGVHAEQQLGRPGAGLQARQAGGARVRRRVRRHRRHRAARGGRRLLRLVPGQRRRRRRRRLRRLQGALQQARREQLGRLEPAVRVPPLRQEVPLEVHPAPARERGVRRQGAIPPMPLLLVQGQAAGQPRRPHPEAPQQRVVHIRQQQSEAKQKDLVYLDFIHI